MKVYELPDDIFTDKNHLVSDIVFYHYSSSKDSFKEKSILKRNAFSLVINGTKTMHFAERTVHVNNTEIHLLSAGNCISTVNIPNKSNFETILVFFDNNVLVDFCRNHSHIISNLKNKLTNTQNYIDFVKDDFIRHFIQSLLLTLKNERQPSVAMKNLKVQELFLYLLENHTDKFLSFGNSQNISDAELKIKKVIEANAGNNLTLEELAFLCNLSVSTFKRHFKKIYNTSPIEWNNQQRMKLASKMLLNEKPSEVWHKLGFETHTGFTKSFKKYYGVLPKDFIKKLSL